MPNDAVDGALEASAQRSQAGDSPDGRRVVDPIDPEVDRHIAAGRLNDGGVPLRE